MRRTMKYLLPFAFLMCLFVACDSSQEGEAQDNGMEQEDSALDVTETVRDVEEYNVPWDDSRSRDPFVAPDGNVYFAGQRGHYIGKFNPQTQEFTEYELEDGAGPHTVVVADDGTVWYTGNASQHIGKLDPETGEITKYMMDNENARDPHTIAFDNSGNFWFTAQGGNGISYFNTGTGETITIPVPTGGARPYGIRMDPSGERPWIALLGTNKLATVDPETMELEEIELPREEARPRRLDVTSDGNVWYGDFNGGYIGRYNPADGSVEEWMMPDGAESRPYGLLADEKDRIWIAASGLNPNKVYGFDTQNHEFFTSIEIESAEGAIRNMDYDEETSSLWFGTDTGHIGRMILN